MLSLPSLKAPRYLPWPERFWQNVLAEPNSGCWLWMGSVGEHGYGQIAKDGGPKMAHRISYKMHHGNIPDGLWVLHKCDTRSCVNSEHLYAGTAADNMRDKVSRCRQNSVRGEAAGRAKLSTADIKKIRSLTGPSEEIGRLYGVSGHQIGMIRRRESWKHV